MEYPIWLVVTSSDGGAYAVAYPSEELARKSVEEYLEDDIEEEDLEDAIDDAFTTGGYISIMGYTTEVLKQKIVL